MDSRLAISGFFKEAANCLPSACPCGAGQNCGSFQNQDLARALVEATGSETSEIDPLLDKIARHGLGSLTSQERAALERARAKLLEKDKG